MCLVFAACTAIDILNCWRIALLQCELSALCRNHGPFSAETKYLPKVIDQYSAENKSCRNTLKIAVFGAETETEFRSVSKPVRC